MNKSKKEPKKSFFLGKLNTFSEFLYKKLPDSMIGSLLSGKIKTNKNGLFSFLKEKIRFKERISLPLKRAVAKAFDRSYILNKVDLIIKRLPYMHLKCIGIALFSFGLYTAADFLIKRNMLGQAELDPAFFFTAILSACAGGILSGSAKSCHTAVCESAILRTLAVRILGIKLVNKEEEASGFGRGNVAFIVGIAAGIMGAWISPYAILATVPILLFVYTTLAHPESGIVALFLLLPFLSSAHLSTLCSLLLFSYIVKLIRGKRTFKLRGVDVTVLAISVLFFFGGIFSVTPSESSELALCLLLLISAYFVVVNTIKTAEWIKRCVYALVCSFILSLILGISGGIINGFAPKVLSELVFFSKNSLFNFNPMLTHLSVVIIPFFSLVAYSGRSKDRKFICIFITLLTLVSLAISSSKSALVSALLGLVILLLISSRKSLTVLVSIAVTIPMAIMLLPSQISKEITDIFTVSSVSASHRDGVLTTVEKIINDCFPGGIGLGEDAFRRIYPLYSHSSFNSVYDTNSLYTQLMVSLGITGLIIFVIFIALFLRRFFSYYVKSQKDNKFLKQTSVSAFSGICALLIMGITGNIWHEPTVFLLFWLITALTVASIRIAEGQRETTTYDGPCIDIDCKDLKKNKTLSGGKR